MDQESGKAWLGSTGLGSVTGVASRQEQQLGLQRCWTALGGLSGHLAPCELTAPCGLSIWASLGFLTAWRTQDKETADTEVPGSRTSVLAT